MYLTFLQPMFLVSGLTYMYHRELRAIENRHDRTFVICIFVHLYISPLTVINNPVVQLLVVVFILSFFRD